MVSPTRPAPVAFWRNQCFRLALYQAVALLLVIGAGGLLRLQESTKNCGAYLMLQVWTRTLDGTMRGSSSSGIRLKAGAGSVEAEPCAA